MRESIVAFIWKERATFSILFPKRTLLFTSSTSVYAQRDGSWVTESDPAKPLHESGRILRETEEGWFSVAAVLLRASLEFTALAVRSFLRQFLAGKAVIDPERDRFVNQVHRDDIAAALFLIAGRGGDRKFSMLWTISRFC